MKPTPPRRPWVIAGIAVAAGLVIALVTLFLVSPSQDTQPEASADVPEVGSEPGPGMIGSRAEGPDVITEAPAPAEQAPEPTAVPAAVWLHELPSVTREPGSGTRVTARYHNYGSIKVDENATAQAMGCTSPATTTYSLDGSYEAIYISPVVRDNAPDGFVGKWTITLDGTLIFDLEGGDLAGDSSGFAADVTGGNELVIEAVLLSDTCEEGVVYGALVNPRVWEDASQVPAELIYED